jgi:hypothetical protein
MIRLIAIEHDYMDERITAITGRLAGLYVYDTTIKIHDGRPCRECYFIRNVSEFHVVGADGFESGASVFDESQDAEGLKRGKALSALSVHFRGGCGWSDLEYDDFSDGNHFECVDILEADSLPFLRGTGRGREAVQEWREYWQGNWCEPKMPWEKELKAV